MRRLRHATGALRAHRSAAYLAGAEVEVLTNIRHDIVSLLVVSSKKALLRHHHNILNERR